MKKFIRKLNSEGMEAHLLGGTVIVISVFALVFLPFSEDAISYSRYLGWHKVEPEYFMAAIIIGTLLIISHYAFLGRRVKLIVMQNWILYKHYNKLILCTLSGGHGAVEYCIPLTQEEREQFHVEGLPYLVQLEKEIHTNSAKFQSRSIKF